LFGKDGAFAPLLKDILEAALEGEMKGHPDEEDYRPFILIVTSFFVSCTIF